MTSPITTDVTKALEAITTGHLCAIPTETVYGLAADADNPQAVARVFESKNRPTDHPLIVHVKDLQTAQTWLNDLPDWAIKLAEEFWPGPLTLVGKKTDHVSLLVTGGQDTVAVRVPAHPLTQELLAQLAKHNVTGLVAPSANRFGHVSPTTAQHVLDDLGPYLMTNKDVILDGGKCQVGLESTIVLTTGSYPVILRPGAITQSDIEKVTGLKVHANAQNKPRVSGSLDSHYAPKAQVELVSPDQVPDEKGAGFIGPSSVNVPANLTILLSAIDDEDYASNLYQALRKCDELGLTKVYAVLPNDSGLATAIIDRLTRAAN